MVGMGSLRPAFLKLKSLSTINIIKLNRKYKAMFQKTPEPYFFRLYFLLDNEIKTTDKQFTYINSIKNFQLTFLLAQSLSILHIRKFLS